jgi:hypothetical protein
MLETGVGADWVEESGGWRGVDSVEEFEENQGDESSPEGKVDNKTREPGKETFGAKFGEIVTQGGERIALRRASESLDDEGMDFCGGKCIGAGNIGEAYEGMHDGKLARVVKL